VSLQFVAACLLRKTGRRAEAAARFRRCAKIDAGYYSPVLGTKSVDALLQAGKLALADGDLAAARADWRQALATADRLLHADWSTFVGDPDQPLAFGLREATDLLDLAASAARGLLDLSAAASRPGRSWELLSFGLRPSIAVLERTVADVTGWNWGGGLYLNYLFTLLWVADTACDWRAFVTGRIVRPRIRLAVRGFLAFMAVNATLVFGPPGWWIVAAITGAALLAMRRGRPAEI